MAAFGRGYNSFHGFDTGPPPPVSSFPPFPGQYPSFQGFPSFPAFTGSAAAPAPVLVGAPPPSYPFFQSFPGYGQPYPAMPPTTNSEFPGVNLNLRNHTGGVGLPPGYDYAFPQEHCKIHVFKTGATPPWQMSISAWDPAHHVKLLVPCNTTVKELMQNLGCTNSDAKKNKMHEVQEAGQGKWVKGLSISGDDKDRVKKLISELGWDKTRTGHPGERPVVWLYCTKD